MPSVPPYSLSTMASARARPGTAAGHPAPASTGQGHHGADTATPAPRRRLGPEGHETDDLVQGRRGRRAPAHGWFPPACRSPRRPRRRPGRLDVAAGHEHVAEPPLANLDRLGQEPDAARAGTRSLMAIMARTSSSVTLLALAARVGSGQADQEVEGPRQTSQTAGRVRSRSPSGGGRPSWPSAPGAGGRCAWGELADDQGQVGEHHGDHHHGRRIGRPAEEPEQRDQRLGQGHSRGRRGQEAGRVMPIWMVDRNWLGSRASLATSRPCSPSRSRRRSWPSRSEIRTTSLPAKAALINTSSRTSPISAQGSSSANLSFSTATGSKRGGPVPCLCMPHSRADKLRSHDSPGTQVRAGTLRRQSGARLTLLACRDDLIVGQPEPGGYGHGR